MPETITQDSKPSFGVTFERTISDGNYGSNKFSAWVSADVPAGADAKQIAEALHDAAFIAKATVYAQIGTGFTNEDGILREAIARVERAFPGTTEVGSGAPNVPNPYPQPGLASGVRVKGQQHGELPTWLVEACAKDGVTEVYDNRADLSDPAKSRRPHFKATTGGDQAKAYWPPRGK